MSFVENYFVLWAVLGIVCEYYLAKKVVDSSGETPWPDDDSKALARNAAKQVNESNSASRRLVRVTYVCVPALILFFISVL
jgi:hypothetical protein